MAKNDTYRIGIDGSWSLEDFYEFPRVFGQVYAFHCAFALEAHDPERLVHTFESFPWRGGYSAVNFYGSLYSQIPPRLRPQVKSIRYASPGWIELTELMFLAAIGVGRVVKGFVNSASALNKLYGEIYEGLHARELMRVEAKREHLELAKRELDFAEGASERLAKGLGFENPAALNELTGNQLATVKILLSDFRRIRTLASYVEEGKAEFPADETGEQD
ncbi:MAG: hypothetical protein ACRD11_10145 [Terriglobia bacterium]